MKLLLTNSILLLVCINYIFSIKLVMEKLRKFFQSAVNDIIVIEDEPQKNQKKLITFN